MFSLSRFSTDMPHTPIDEEDPGTIDDVNTSESECSPKIRRKQKKKCTGRHRRCKKSASDASDENKENVNSVNKALAFSDLAMIELNRRRALTPPLRQHIKLNLPEFQLELYLKHYQLSANDIKSQGYPYRYGDKAGFFKKRFSGGVEYFAPIVPFDVNAREFVPNNTRRSYKDERKLSVDSGQASGSSSPSTPSSSAPSTDSDSSDLTENSGFEGGEKKCVRCTKDFYVNKSGEYLKSEKCYYHWGKVGKTHPHFQTYTCCGAERYAPGCTEGVAHVWNGYQMGFNGPFVDYVETQPSERQNDQVHNGVYALDCEMCYTGLGLELTKVTVVGSDGRLVYEKFVRPQARIIDYNTRFSGITKKDLAARNGTVVTLPEVQQDLLKIFHADTILIGHALENDLRVLKMVHNTIVDTSVTFPHFNGPGYKLSLRSLTWQILKRTIQDSEHGHSSFEDSRACLELMLWRVRKDFRTIIEQ